MYCQLTFQDNSTKIVNFVKKENNQIVYIDDKGDTWSSFIVDQEGMRIYQNLSRI